MIKLIQNEWMKIFKRTGTYVMIGLLLFVLIVMGGFIKYQDSKGSVPDNSEWKKGLQGCSISSRNGINVLVSVGFGNKL